MKFKKRIITNYNWGKLGLELLVVFLGMTAGFVLNNWQEKEKEEIIEQKYLNSFVKDVDENINGLLKFIESDSIWLAEIQPNLIAIREKTLTTDSATIVFNKILVMDKVTFYSGTYEDITNSGSLNLIQNFELKTKIVDYNLKIEGVEFIDNHFYNYFNEHVMSFVFAEYDVLKGKLKNPDVIYTIQFSNVLAGYYSMVGQRYLSYKEFLAENYLFKKELVSVIN